MKILYILIFFLSTSLTFAADAFQQGIDAYHESEYEAASSAFQQAVTAEETAAAQHNLALALYQTGKISESVWHLERAVLLDPLNKQYQFKLGALRQQLGLITLPPKWHAIATRALSQTSWILLLCVAFWITLAAFCLPQVAGTRPTLQMKALRLVGLIVAIIAATALYLNRHLAHQGIVLSETPATLHAAPASAAPQTGLARPGERCQAVDQYGDYLKVETEGGASGWIDAEQYRAIQ